MKEQYLNAHLRMINTSPRPSSAMRQFRPLDSPHCYDTQCAEVMAASPGLWRPKPQCKTPRMWLFMSGQLRTFPYTAANIADTWRKSSSYCLFSVAVAPEEVCSAGRAPGLCEPVKGHVLEWRAFTAQRNGSVALLAAAQHGVLQQRLAYVVVRWVKVASADGHNSFKSVLPWYWRSLYQLAEKVALYHRFTPSPTSLIVRAR